MPTIHVIVKGKVQGVFYRASAKKMADEYSVTGWVKNIKNDCVEMAASGSQQALQKFMDWCKKGPARANVTEVIVNEKDEYLFEKFIIKR